ncbi:ral guanine nucleotide dissociation stimulator-like 3 isoform X3 [Heterocephalus glaber]|uniref:Ral guanine nucleotide dissociation stimulator-like 3 isoform X3 n=1 Tax=Heterocephalus glaber TaxID=10181 RepID=A0AAX6RVG9_HETGA|nr:ral guanine nucleotide dissociation stimulator-like 3 isoform X3 [Heterocephalus glaber]
MERSAGKELALAPLQDWGEESEDGVVFSVTLRRQQHSLRSGPGEGPARSQVSGRGRGRGCPDAQVRRGPRARLGPLGAVGLGAKAEFAGHQSLPPAAHSFLHYRTSKVRALRAARLERLVGELVYGDREQDPGFVPAFLATHQAFAPTARVLRFLLPPPPPPLPPGIPSKTTGGPELSLNENLSAVVSVLGSWLRDHPQDFRDPPAYSDLGSVRVFLGWAAPEGAEAQEAEKLLQEFLEEADREQEEEQPVLWAGPPRAAQPPRPDSPEEEEGPELLDFSVEEKLFLRVRTCECLGSVWSQRDRQGASGVAPTVRATVAQFNAVTGCVLGSVLGAPGLAAPQRAQRIEKWIRIAQCCRELRNFSSLRAILSALQSNPIYRLKRSWGAVNREPLSTFRKLSQIFSDENNHLNSREILSQKLPSGLVPYLGTFLTDLVMLDTALPDVLKGDLINFEKRRKVSGHQSGHGSPRGWGWDGEGSQRPPPQEWEILARIQQLQRRCRSYSLCPHPPILAALQAQRQLSEEQSYRVSRVIEPPAASCPSSPSIRRRISLTKRLSAKLSREKSAPPGGSPGEPSSPTSSLSPGSPPSSPRAKDPPAAGSPPASPGLQGPCTKHLWPAQLPLSLDLPGSQAPALPPSSPRVPLGQQSSEARVIRVSIDNDHGNLYRSILLSSQDKAPGVIQRALEKHHVPQPQGCAYQLFQVLPGDRELLIPDNANVFYAMSPAAPGDFVLRRKDRARTKDQTRILTLAGQVTEPLS